MSRDPIEPFDAPRRRQAFDRNEARILYFAAAFVLWMLARVVMAWIDGRLVF